MGKRKPVLREILSAAVFLVVVIGLFILNIVAPKPSILVAERRIPAKFPELSPETIASGSFMSKLNGYAADNFVFRDAFRSIRAFTVFDLFMQTDKNGLYFDAKGAGEFKPVNPGSVEQAAGKIITIADGLGDMDIYYAFIPDKSMYSDKNLPGFDPVLTEKLLTGRPGMERYTFIGLTDELDADSFYGTDFHWNQVRLGGVLGSLGAAMGFNVDLSNRSEEYAEEFQGIYAGQLALPLGTDSLYYYPCPYLTAQYLNERTMEMEAGPVYDWKKFTGLDAYDFFLSGAQPLIILENEDAGHGRELYLFRDSFASSLAPLLAGAYSRVVLIDLRYIDMRTVGRYVEFKPGSDALFLYSTQILNNADKLLVR